MNKEQLKEQLEITKRSLKKMSETLAMFDSSMQLAIVEADNKDKKTAEHFRVTCNKIVNLAKEGKAEEVKSLISEAKKEWELK